MAFEPKNEVAYWKMLYDSIEDLEVGTVLTYDELSEMTGADINTNRSAVYRASKQLQLEKKRMLISVRGVGYKIVEGLDVYYHADDRHLRAKKQIKLADFETKHINTTKLTPDEKNKLQNFMVANRRIQMAMTEGIENIEEATKQTINAQAFTASEIMRLKELLGNE